MTKEEYKKQLARMWDSIRTMNKGEENCGGVRCTDCPLYTKGPCGPVFAFEYIELVENWAKQHPVKTNSQKFEEVFGFDMSICFDCDKSCEECQFCDRNGTCNSKEKFWEAEYKPTKEGEE